MPVPATKFEKPQLAQLLMPAIPIAKPAMSPIANPRNGLHCYTAMGPIAIPQLAPLLMPAIPIANAHNKSNCYTAMSPIAIPQ